MPAWYGSAYIDFNTFSNVCYPVPINIAIRWWNFTFHRIRKFLRYPPGEFQMEAFRAGQRNAEQHADFDARIAVWEYVMGREATVSVAQEIHQRQRRERPEFYGGKPLRELTFRIRPMD